MTTRKTTRRPLQPRKTPSQRRSAETVAIILEAAARILELGGFEAFNTNAVAAKAGVSIGSLYQYFPNKDALLSGLLDREYAPLLLAGEATARTGTWEAALREYIRVSVRHQMQRPKLARLLDMAEMRETFQHQVSGTRSRLQAVVERILRLPKAPRLQDVSLAASDLLAIIRTLVDAAGERGESASTGLLRRVEGAVWGYLRAARAS